MATWDMLTEMEVSMLRIKKNLLCFVSLHCNSQVRNGRHTYPDIFFLCGLLVPCLGLYPVLCMKSSGGNLASVPGS